MTHNAIPPFEFAGLPTRVIMAAGAIDRIAEYVHAAGGTRVMLVCGGKTGQSRLVQRSCHRSQLLSRTWRCANHHVWSHRV